MSAHFIYQHLPASGFGQREPRRPYVTGGLGRVTFSHVLRMRVNTISNIRPTHSTVEGVRP